MHLAVAHRAGTRDGASERTLSERLLGEYEATKANWVAAERDAMINSLKTRIAGSTAASPTRSAPPRLATEGPALLDVAEPDRAVYAQAMDLVARNPREAWKKAEPLFTRYPDVYVVQDLRCKLALQLSSQWEDARPECERLMNLSR